MNILFANNYAGNVLGIKIEHDFTGTKCLVVNFTGYIETHTQKLKYIGTDPIYLKDSVIFFKIPHNIIPTHHSKHFKVWYECTVSVVYDEFFTCYSTEIEIKNNNLSDFIFKEFVVLRPISESNYEYLICKALVALFIAYNKIRDGCFKIKSTQENDNLVKRCEEIERMLKIDDLSFLTSDEFFSKLLPQSNSENSLTMLFESTDNGISDKTFIIKKQIELEDGIIIHDSSLFKEYEKKLLLDSKNRLYYLDEIVTVEKEGLAPIDRLDNFPLLQRIMNNRKIPVFNDFNIFTIDKKVKKFYVYKDSKKIAQISHQAYFHENSNMIIAFLENIKKVEITLFKMQLENQCLIDAEVCWTKKIDTDGCVEKMIDLDLKEFGLKTFIFEINYSINIILDGFEVSYDLVILDSSSKYRILDNDS